MKIFNVYKHPNHGFEAVKVGFSWPALFFTFWWMLAKKLWGWAVLWFVKTVAIAFFNYANQQVPESSIMSIITLFLFPCLILIILLPGLKGNKWRERNLLQRGFQLQSTTNAPNVTAAIAKIANPEI